MKRLLPFGVGLLLLFGPVEFTLASIHPVDTTATNPVRTTPITSDGNFSTVDGEWIPSTPLAFIMPPDDSGELQQATGGNPNINSLLYSAIAPGIFISPDALYLFYDIQDRRIREFASGEFIFDVEFPFTVDNVVGDLKIVATGTGEDPPGGTVTDYNLPTNFEVFFDGESLGDLSDIPGASGGRGHTITPFFNIDPHLTIELGIPLNFVVGESGSGPTGYSPDPAFWSSNAANDLVDPPSSAALFTIDPITGATIMTSDVVPEPTTFIIWSLLGCIGLTFTHRRRSS